MTTAILLVDHGSKSPRANGVVETLARALARRGAAPIVRHAHLELAAPTIAEGFSACVAAGADLVVVHPYFLAPGRHAAVHIPEQAAAAARSHPGVRHVVTEPLGFDPAVASVVARRVREALDATGTARMDTMACCPDHGPAALATGGIG